MAQNPSRSSTKRDRSSPAQALRVITPADVDLEPVPLALYVPVACSADLTNMFDQNDPLAVPTTEDGVALIAGYHPITPLRVRAATGTIYGLYDADNLPA